MSASVLFGQSLRAARERRGLTVEQLSRETTIPVADIEALESGAVGSLPRAMYRRAEVRAYAEAVGVDPWSALAELQSAATTRLASIDAPASVESPSIPPPVASDSPPSAVPSVLPTPIAAPPPGPVVEPDNVVPPSPARERAHLRLVAPVVAARHVTGAKASDATRAGRAVIVLLIGCGVLLMNRDEVTPPATPDVVSQAAVVPVSPQAVIDEVERIVEPIASAPSLRRVFYEPRIAANGHSWPRDGRLDGGVLVVHSTPPGARVTVNGVGWGETPIAIRYLPMGLLRVRVAKPDYRGQERTVLLTHEQPATTLRLSLPQLRRRAPAAPAVAKDMLVITSVPAGARVTVNGIGWGTTPLSIPHLPAGTQRVRLVKEQFRSEERVVHVGAEQQGRLDVTMKPQS